MVAKIDDNTTKIKQNKVLPYLVSKVVEVSQSLTECLRQRPRTDCQILDVDEEIQEGATYNEQNAKKSKCAVIKTTTRQVCHFFCHVVYRRRADIQTIFLPIIGLVPHEELRPSDLIGVNKDSYLILDKLPAGKLAY